MIKNDDLYLTHILESIEKIESYTNAGKVSFLADPKTQDAVIRNLQTLAESTQRISEKLKSQHPKIEWKAMAGFRNVLVHDYLGISINNIWNIVEKDLPTLKAEIEKILDKIN